VGSVLGVLSVLFQQDIGVVFTGTVGRGDIVLFGFEPFDDLFDGLIIRLLTFRVNLGQYFVQSFDADLGVVNEVQYAPTNCWRFRDSPSLSPVFIMLQQILFIA